MTNLICLAKIVAAHGIKGEVKLKSFTNSPKDVFGYGMLSNKDGTRFFEPVFKGFLKELLRVQIKGVETRNDAESLIGTELYVARDKLPELEKDVFYQADLIGADVLDAKTLQATGKVVGVYNFGAGDILEIKFDELKQTEMIPFNETYVADVNVQNKTITVFSGTMNYQKDEEQTDA